MPFFPGDIITDITNLMPSAKRGEFQFQQGNERCVLDDYVQADRIIHTVEKAVCVGASNAQGGMVYHFRISKYRSKVMDRLYNNGSLKWCGKEASHQRWQELAFSSISPEIEKFVPKASHRNQFKTWRLAITKNWEMPLPVSEYCDCINNTELIFSPYPLPYREQQTFLSPCYPVVIDGLPFRFKGQWSQNNGKHREVDIVLHGFLELRKMHFGVRKHVLGCCGEPPQAMAATQRTLAQSFVKAGMPPPRESDYWRRLMGEIYEACNCDPFQGCPKSSRDNAVNCPLCTLETFTVVQDRITPLAARYSQEFVTVLQQMAKKDNSELKVWGKNPTPTNGGSVRLQSYHEPINNLTMKAVFDGVFYDDLAGTNRKPVLHLSMLTLYFSNDQFTPLNNYYWYGTIKLT